LRALRSAVEQSRATSWATSAEGIAWSAELERAWQRLSAISKWPRTSLEWAFATPSALLVRALRARDWATARSLIAEGVNDEATVALVNTMERYQALLHDASEHLADLTSSECVDLATAPTARLAHTRALLDRAASIRADVPVQHWLALAERLSETVTLADVLSSVLRSSADGSKGAYATLSALWDAAEKLKEMPQPMPLTSRIASQLAALADPLEETSLLARQLRFFGTLHKYSADLGLSEAELAQVTPDNAMRLLALKHARLSEAEALSNELKLPWLPTLLEALQPGDLVPRPLLAVVAAKSPLLAALCGFLYRSTADLDGFSMDEVIASAKALPSDALARFLSHRFALLTAINAATLGLSRQACDASLSLLHQIVVTSDPPYADC